MAAVLFFSFLLLLLSSISPSTQDVRESVPLLRFKTSVNITNGDLHSWKKGTDPCNGRWFGIYCHKGKSVSGIHITGLGLSGTIDVVDLQDLPNLRTIRLDNNLLSGPIPFFFLISGLRSLMLSNNSFSGEIPDDYFLNMTQIRRLFLDHNHFEGTIPSTIFQLPNIEEIHLQNNSFSGPIPELSPKTKMLKTLDISNNKLKGDIPYSIADRKNLNVSVTGNGGICGKRIMIECNAPLEGDGENVTESQWNGVTIAAMITCFTLLSIFFIVIAIINKRNNKKQPEFLILDKGTSNENDDVQVKVPESIATKKRGANIDGSSTKKGLLSQDNKDHVNGGGMSDIIMVNSEKGSFGLPDLMKAAAEVLGNGSLGSAYKAVMSNGLSVVVKRIRDMNKLTHEAFDVEMRRFGKLRHPNILTPLAYHYRREEKLVVSEYMPNSSLLYVLHGKPYNALILFSQFLFTSFIFTKAYSLWEQRNSC